MNQRKRKHAIKFCAAYGIASTEWTYVLFALLTKSLSLAIVLSHTLGN